MAYKKTTNILLIDVPTYKVELPSYHRDILKSRLRAQSIILENRLKVSINRPGLTYSRSLLTIASFLERDGYLVKYLNYSDPTDRKQITSIVKDFNVVGITTLTPTFNIVKSICMMIKEINPHVKIILGGPHINAKPKESLLQNKYADVAAAGDGYIRLPSVMKNIYSLWKVGGIFFRDDHNEIIKTKQSIESTNVDDIPLPAYHLLNRPLDDYAHNIRTTNGCPYTCKFCNERHSFVSFKCNEYMPENVVEELAFLDKQLKPNTLVHISDAIFNYNWDRTSYLLKLIKKQNFHTIFSFDTRVDFVETEQVQLLYKTGFRYIRLGFESVHNDILSLSGKNITPEAQLNSSRIIRGVSENIAIHAYMLTGLPGATLRSLSSDALHICHLIDEDIVDVVGNKIFVPYPGTPFFDNREKLGLEILTEDWSKYDRRSYPVFELNGLNSYQIYFGYLFQEASLLKSYLIKLHRHGIQNSDLDKVSRGLDYLYTNYIEN